MLKRALMLCTALLTLLTAALMLSVPVTLAIDEVTPTPVPVEATNTLVPLSPANPTPVPLSPSNPTPVPLSPAEPTSVPLNPSSEGALPQLSAEVQELMDTGLEQLQAGDYQAVIETMTQALEL